MPPTIDAPEDLSADGATPLPTSGVPASQVQSNVDWDAIVRQIQAGDETAVEFVYKTFQRGLRYLLVRQLGPHDFEDTMSNIFLVVFDAIRRKSIREPARLPGFVRTVASRQIAQVIQDRMRSRQHDVELDTGLHVAETKQDPETQTFLAERAGIVKKALESLPARDREVLVRFYLKEQTQDEICQEMRLTETQFRLCKSRAKAKFGQFGQRELTKRAAASSLVPHRYLRREIA